MKIDSVKNEKKRIPLVCINQQKDKIMKQTQKLINKGFNLRMIKDPYEGETFDISTFDLLKESNNIHKSMINGSRLEYRTKGIVRFVLHPMSRHLNTLVLINNSGIKIEDFIQEFRDYPSIASNNTKIMFIEEEDSMYSSLSSFDEKSKFTRQ